MSRSIFGTVNMILAMQLMILGCAVFLAFRELGQPMEEAGNLMMLLWFAAMLMLFSRPLAMAFQAVVNMVVSDDE